MRKFLLLPVLFFALFFGGCSYYSQNQVTKLIQQESAASQAEIDTLKQQASDLQNEVNDLTQKASPTAVQPAPTAPASAPSSNVANDSATKGKYVTYLISKESTLQYCNGGSDDNSNAYRKTITTEVESDILIANTANGVISQIDLVKQILALSADCGPVDFSSPDMKDMKVENGVVRIPPIDSWAGASITMCSCVPQVEVNLLRLPGITKVVWEPFF